MTNNGIGKLKSLSLNKDYFNKEEFITTSGLESKDIENLEALKEQDYFESTIRFQEFKEAIKEMVSNQEFLNRVLSRIELLERFGKCKWTKDSLTGSLKGKINYKTTIKVMDDKVYYSTMTDNTFTRGTMKRIKEHVIITYSDIVRESEEVVEEDSLEKIVSKTVNNTKTYVFGENGKQLSVKKSKREQNDVVDRKQLLENKRQLLLEHDIHLSRKNILEQEESFEERKEVPQKRK